MTSETPQPSLPLEVLDYYNRGLEIERLSHGLGLLEWARGQELEQRHIPPPPSIIYDIGGGPGAYSIWLAQLGYEVHLVDSVPLHVDQALQRSRSQSRHPIAGVTCGDARSLAFPDESADAVILHGPLYHLVEHEDRLSALSQVARVLRPGGVLLAFAIPRYASTLVGLARWWTGDADYRAMCSEELATGVHRQPQSWPRLFTAAYFHRLGEPAAEIAAVGLTHETTLAIEGPCVIVPDLEARMSDPIERDVLLSLMQSMETDTLSLSMSTHIVGVARKA